MKKLKVVNKKLFKQLSDSDLKKIESLYEKNGLVDVYWDEDCEEFFWTSRIYISVPLGCVEVAYL